jgi:hypothetical protein
MFAYYFFRILFAIIVANIFNSTEAENYSHMKFLILEMLGAMYIFEFIISKPSTLTEVSND